MIEQKEIRCINSKGIIRYISEHLTKDNSYMQKMGLTIQDAEQKEHFKTLTENKAPEIAKNDDDEFSLLLAQEEKENKKKNK